MRSGKKLGEILVERGIVTGKTVDRMLVRARQMKKRFGRVLEEMELVTGEELANALAVQFRCKVVSNLADMTFSPELFKLIPLNVAMQNDLFPLKLDRGKLAIAMADPTDTRIVANIGVNQELKIVPFVATKRDIHTAICRHYLGKMPTSSTQRTVLAVEEDKLVLTRMGDVLAKNGYRVVTAPNGMDAFREVIAERPHVIITARDMPKMGGYTFLEAVKNVPETMFVPVILITGNTMSAEEEAKAFDKGFFDVLIKPVKDVTLLARVKRAFHFHDHQYRLF